MLPLLVHYLKLVLSKVYKVFAAAPNVTKNVVVIDEENKNSVSEAALMLAEKNKKEDEGIKPRAINCVLLTVYYLGCIALMGKFILPFNKWIPKGIYDAIHNKNYTTN